MFNQSKTQFGLLMGFSLCSVSLFFAALFHRNLTNEASEFFYNVLKNSGPSFDHQYYRYSNLLLQLPAIGILKYFGPAGANVALKSLEFLHGLHPVLSVLFCLWYLKQKGRSELLVYPLLSFATGTMSTIAFSVSVVTDSLSIFWPLFLILFLYRRDETTTFKFFEIVIASLCSLALLFTHETAIFLFLPLLVLSFRRGYLGTVFVLAGIVWYIKRLSHLPPHIGDTFRQFTAAEYFDSFRLFALWTSASAILLYGLAQKWSGAALNKAVLVLATALAVWFFCFSDYGFGLPLGYHSRSNTTMHGAIAALLLYCEPFNKRSAEFRNALAFLVIVALLTGAFFDAYTTSRWKQTANRLEALVKVPGCHFVKLSDMALEGNVGAMTSVLMQSTLKPKAIVFYEGECVPYNIHINPCLTYDGEKFNHQCPRPFPWQEDKFDYSEVIGSLPK